MNFTRLAAALVLSCAALSACGEKDTNDGGADASTAELPVVQLHEDEVGPASVAEAVKQSDYVVIATVGEQRDGARYFGDAEEGEGGLAYEAVEWTLNVERWLKGPGDTNAPLTLRSTAYVVDGSKTPERVAAVEVGGVQMPLSSKKRYVLFLKNEPEPWGIITVSAGAGIMELDASDRVAGQVSDVYASLRGDELADVLPPAVADRL
jgi:hypothetical protein